MDSDIIYRLIQNDKACDPMFLGVFACDRLPRVLPHNEPTLMICNTDPHTQPGKHWIAVYFDNSYGEYFDSFGRQPEKPFLQYLNSHCRNWIFNETKLQSIISAFCGHYCVYYCLLRARNKNINTIVGQFTSDTALNDSLVHRFICKKLSYTN
jgi:hypothetical protein